MPFTITRNVHVRRDRDGRVRLLRHLQEPYTAQVAALAAPTTQALAAAYTRDVAAIFEIDPAMLTTLGEKVGRVLKDEGSRLRLAEEKSILNTSPVSYRQTHLGLPIWEAGFTVRIQGQPLRVTSSESSVHYNVQVQKPDPKARFMPDRITPPLLVQLLGLRSRAKRPRINRTGLLIYRYDPAKRFDPESQHKGPLQGGPPTLPLRPVPETIRPGRYYVVTEVLFSLAPPGWRNLHWRAFVEPKTGAVLYLRAFVASATGQIFRRDPLTLTGDGTITPCSDAADLDPLAETVTLLGLTPPAAGDPQALSGEFVVLGELADPVVAPPTEPLPGDFSYSVVTDNFAAVNAYYHCDGLFRMMADMGFDLPTYFADTMFPITVDHRDASLGEVNARGYGNAAGNGAGGMGFNFAQSGCPVGIAADLRVVSHEFCHELLYEHVESPNFGFAHSAGDSLAAILCDPESQAPDRFLTFPWISIATVPPDDRRHDRAIGDGWAWGGVNDTGGYNSEQILSTTMFRVYRSTGGDSTNIDKERFGARYVAYLIIKAIGALSPATNPSDPDGFATALMDADAGTLDFDGIAGGAVHKVIRWGFEKQGLYQPAGAPTPVTSEGDPPDVDVYIDDGRNGEYEYLANFWNTEDIWNRLAADGGTEHETPVLSVTNYLYVRVKNRGTQTADDVVVKVYHCAPAAGLVWPDDWVPATTPELTAGSILSGDETIVGPFEWTPEEEGHECLLATVSADGDLSNIDPASLLPSATGPSPHWRLVPFDNNIAQRNVAPVPGGGGGLNLAAAFERRRFWARNPYDRTVRVRIDAILPEFLRRRKWEVRFLNAGGSSFTLGPRGSRQIVLGLKRGEEFSPADVRAAGKQVAIVFHMLADGVPVGGMTYAIDPKMKTPAPEHPEDLAKPDCTEAARRLLECLKCPAGEVKSVRVKRITVDIDLEGAD